MLGIPDHPIARFVNLWFNVGQALRVPWLQVPRAIGGDWGSLNPPHGYETELAALEPLFSGKSLATIAHATGIGWPIPGSWIKPLHSGPLGVVHPPSGPNRDERWFFLNGICTDHRVAHLNANLVHQLFGRPTTILYNATEGVWLDLVECAVGKAWDSVTDAAERNLDALLDALCDDDLRHVVLVSHSQGTIIAAVLLKVLEEMLLAPRPAAAGEEKVSPERRVARKIARRPPETRAAHGRQPAPHRRALRLEDVGKLELYCFANCATSMEPFVRLTGPARVAPWIESYGNENDVVAKLGLLAPPHGIGSARIAGDRYRIPGAWGHLFNAHYAIPMFVRGATLEPFHDNIRGMPRVCEYLGGRPAPPIP